MHRTALRLVTAAALAAAAVPAAQAAPATLVSAGGRALRPGSVVATGRLDGDVCVFGDAATVTLRGRTSAGVALRADAACRLVVTAVDSGLRNANLWSYDAHPKVDENGDEIGAGASALGGLPSVSAVSALGAASNTTSVDIALSQSVYNAVGSLQYEDLMDVSYLKNTKTGALSALEPTGGWCRAGQEDDPGYDITKEVVTTEIRDCFYKGTASGPDKVAFFTGGYYRQIALGRESDARQLVERFEERRDGYVSRTCETGGTLPRYWTNYCFLNRVV